MVARDGQPPGGLGWRVRACAGRTATRTSTKKKGTVISSSPARGKNLPAGTKVALALAKTWPAASQASVKVSDGTRTRDRLDHNQELYQLSYAHRDQRNLPAGWRALPRLKPRRSRADTGRAGTERKGVRRMQGGRISRGWALAKKSWAVLKSDRSLLLFPIVSAACAFVAGAILFAPGVALYASDDQEAWLIGFGILAVYGLTFIGIFFATALAGAAVKALQGEDTSLGDGIAVARGRIGQIALWALVQTTVGLILNLIQSALRENPLVGAIVSGLLNFAWQVLTFFVIPIIAIEGLGPVDAIKRSAAVLRERWGEGLVGTVSIGGVIGLLAILPAILLGVAGGVVLQNSAAAGIAMIAVAAAVLLVAMLVVSTLTAIFRVALYLYATEGKTVGGFEAAELEHAFAPRKSRLGRA
jgi:Family of unknown function (DUF6159)